MEMADMEGWGSRRGGRRGIRFFELALLLLLLPGSGIGAQSASVSGSGTGARSGSVSASGPGRQAEPLTLSLEEAVQMALRQSRDIRDARLALEEAGDRVSEAWGSVYPKVDFSGSYTRNIAPAVSFLPARIFDPEAPEGQFMKVQFGADNAWSSAIVLDQPLFEARAFIGVGAAGRYQTLQEETLRGRAQSVVTRVRLEFYGLLLAQEERRLIQNSVGRVRASLEETEALNRAGLASDYDVLRLQVELANLVPNLRRTDNALRQARRQLAMELNLEDLEGLEVTGSLASMDLENPDANDAANREILVLGGSDDLLDLELEELLGVAFETRSDLRQLELTERLRTAELRVQQVEFLPKVSLFGSFQVNSQQNGSPSFFGDPMTRATSKWLGVSVSVPVFTGFQRTARIDQSRALLRQVQNQSAMARLQAEGQVKSFLEQSEEALERARGQRLAVGQAARGFEIASAQYREGLSSQLELTDAEVALRQSEYNYAQAVYDYLVFRAQLDEAVGRVPMVGQAARGLPLGR
jgi:outer membrane protein